MAPTLNDTPDESHRDTNPSRAETNCGDIGWFLA
jgi:hypothetical protein